MNHPALQKKTAGILIPVFSLRTAGDMGVGEYLDALPFIDWMRDKGFSVFNTLPLCESFLDSGCPYTALSAFALDPVFLSLEAVEDVRKSPAALRLLRAPSSRKAIAAWRQASEVQYLPIRQFKFKVLGKAFERFMEEERSGDSPRANAFKRFVDEHRTWLDAYAAFRTLKEKYEWESWTLWPERYRKMTPEAMQHLREKTGHKVDFFKYLQWLCHEQWMTVRSHAAKKGVWILGDLAFLVERESSDVWSRQDEFSLEATVGAPPDMFNPEGQRWGVPAYVWPRLEATDFDWWRSRIRQAAELYDVFRIDHVVGFFRMYLFPKEGPPGFSPSDEPGQAQRGDRFLRLVLEELGRGGRKAYPIAEDLGVIPPFVRKTMDALQIPGYKVLRWEKDKKGESFLDPAQYAACSLAVPGTHDTSTIAAWWQDIDEAERRQLLAMLHHHPWEGPVPAFTDAILTKLQGKLLEAGSVMSILPVQDLFGWRGQVNVPGTVGSHNWTWRMPVAIERLDAEPELKIRGEILRELIEQSGRKPVQEAVKL